MESFFSIFECINESTCLSFDEYSILKEVLPLALHEYTHFIDSTSTVWGVKFLELMERAYVSDDRRYSGTEKDFHFAKKFYDLNRFSKLPKYYTYDTGIESSARPWSAQESIGRRYSSEGIISEYPILFTWFSNGNGDRVVRSPISTLSILECSAMAQEINSTIQLINLLESNTRTVEIRLYKENILGYIYNRSLTEYSVCAHLFANKFKESDIVIVYKACAVLCRYVLNAPNIVYKKISENFDFTSIFGVGAEVDAWICNIKKGLYYGEPGFLFYLVCLVIPKSDGCSSVLDEIEQVILKAFLAIGVDIEYFKQEAGKEYLESLNYLNNSKIDIIKTISKSGYCNFKKINWNNYCINFNEINIPPVMLGDSSVVNIMSENNNSLYDLNLDDVYDELVEGQIWVERFVEACH